MTDILFWLTSLLPGGNAGIIHHFRKPRKKKDDKITVEEISLQVSAQASFKLFVGLEDSKINLSQFENHRRCGPPGTALDNASPCTTCPAPCSSRVVKDSKLPRIPVSWFNRDSVKQTQNPGVGKYFYKYKDSLKNKN